MEKKLHYKLHKVKKHWVTIAVASIGLVSLIGAGTVSAEDKVANDTAAQTSQAADTNQGDQATSSDTNTNDPRVGIIASSVVKVFRS